MEGLQLYLIILLQILMSTLKKSKRKYIARAISLSNSMSLITAISNDISYDKIFTEQIENFYDKGDCIMVFSCSGTSKNIIEICKYAKKEK